MPVRFDLHGISGVIPAGKDKFYVAPNDINGIFVVDLKTRNIRRVCEIPWKYPFFAVDMVEKDHAIWCIARKGLQISCYDLQTHRISMYIGNDTERANLTAVLHKDDIYIFPKDLPGKVIGFSLKDRKYHDKTEWDSAIKGLDIHDHLRIYTLRDGILTATLKNSAAIIIFDIEKHSSYVSRIDVRDAFWGITAIKDGYYMTSGRSKRIYYLDTIMNKIILYRNDDKSGFYHQIWKVGDCVFLSGIDGIDVFQDGMFRSLIRRAEKTSMDGISAYLFLQEFDKKIFLWPWNADRSLEIDRDTFQYREYLFQMPFRDHIHLFPVMVEGDMTLKDYIDECIGYRTDIDDHEDIGNIGRRVFQYIKEKGS